MIHSRVITYLFKIWLENKQSYLEWFLIFHRNIIEASDFDN